VALLLAFSFAEEDSAATSVPSTPHQKERIRSRRFEESVDEDEEEEGDEDEFVEDVEECDEDVGGEGDEDDDTEEDVC